MRRSRQHMPDTYQWKHCRQPAQREHGRQSTTGRANHQAQEKKSSPSFTSPAPSRRAVRRSLPFLTACGELVRGVSDLETPRSLGYCETSNMSLRFTSRPLFRRVTRQTCFLSAFVAVMFTRRCNMMMRGGPRLCS